MWGLSIHVSVCVLLVKCACSEQGAGAKLLLDSSGSSFYARELKDQAIKIQLLDPSLHQHYLTGKRRKATIHIHSPAEISGIDQYVSNVYGRLKTPLGVPFRVSVR